MVHSGAAAHEPQVIMPNAKSWLEGYKAAQLQAVEQWNCVLQSDEAPVPLSKVGVATLVADLTNVLVAEFKSSQQCSSTQFKAFPSPGLFYSSKLKTLDLSHSEWFGVKWFTVEKLTDSDFFTVEVMGTRRHNVYDTNIVILFTIRM